MYFNAAVAEPAHQFRRLVRGNAAGQAEQHFFTGIFAINIRHVVLST